jgi:DNA (cytosine-5)-methyltransferase 1
MRIVELFSGIGSQVKALNNIGVNVEVVHTCEWDIHSFCAYDLMHNGVDIHEGAKNLSKEDLLEKLSKYTLSLDGKEPMKDSTRKSLRVEVLRRIYSAILKTKNLVSINDVHGEDIGDNIDLMTYSFPCQDLSNVGSFHGYNKGIDRESGSRSSLLWQVERILGERQMQGLGMPKFLMLENVPSLLAPRHRSNFEEWINNLKKLGYTSKFFRLMATDFGLPQTRYRLIMVSAFTGNDEKKVKLFKEYFQKHDLDNKEYIKTLKIKHKKLASLLQFNYDDPIILKEALSMQPNDTDSRRDIWRDNPHITTMDSPQKPVLKYVPTLTTKQDRHPNSGNIYFDYEGNTKSKFRYLTPRECFLLMGYDKKDYEIIINNNLQSRANSLFFYRDKLIRLAGNSIAIPVLENVFKEVIELDKLI